MPQEGKQRKAQHLIWLRVVTGPVNEKMTGPVEPKQPVARAAMTNPIVMGLRESKRMIPGS